MPIATRQVLPLGFLASVPVQHALEPQTSLLIKFSASLVVAQMPLSPGYRDYMPKAPKGARSVMRSGDTGEPTALLCLCCFYVRLQSCCAIPVPNIHQGLLG